MNIRHKATPYAPLSLHGPLNRQTWYFRHLKESISDSDIAVVKHQDQTAHPKREIIICCKACQQIITKDEFSVSVDGNHEHIQCNPYGLTFIFRCFNQVWHCLEVGERQSAHSWFQGFDWTLTVCESCTTHLGWAFTHPAGMKFWGLISDRLMHQTSSS